MLSRQYCSSCLTSIKKNYFSTRITSWWQFIAQRDVTWLLFGILTRSESWNFSFCHLASFYIAYFSLGAWGYLINDFYDQSKDLQGKKLNIFNGTSHKQLMLALLFILPLNSAFFWSILGVSQTVWYLLFAEFILLILYSMPPISLKGRGFFGALADALYGRVIPSLVVLLIFSNGLLEERKFFIIVFILWSCCHGLRSILTHQMEDRTKDANSGITTWYLTLGRTRSILYIRRIILLETLFALVLFWYIFQEWAIIMPLIIAILWILVVFFQVETKSGFSSWRSKYCWRYWINPLYEVWLPIIFGVELVLRKPDNWVLVLSIFVIFPQLLSRLYMNVKSVLLHIRMNSKKIYGS